MAIDHLKAVRITVKRNPKVSLVLSHRCHQGLRRGGPHAMVDVAAVRRAADAHDLGAQLVEHGRRDVVGRTVGSVDHYLHPFQAEAIRYAALAELDVAARRIVNPARTAQCGRIHPLRVLSKRRLDLKLPGIGQFGAVSREELDAVVTVGVV